MPRTAFRALSFAALVAALGCHGTQRKIDAAGTVGTDGGASGATGRGGTGGGSGTTGSGGFAGASAAAGSGGGVTTVTGTAGGGGGASGGSGAACNAANHSFAATPVMGGGSCTFTLPAPDNGQSGFIVRPDDGTGITRDTAHQNGWDYTDGAMRTIQIFGPTCSAFTEGTVRTICIEFQFTSDRNAKDDIEPIDRDAILEQLSRLPISTWRYRTDAERTRHIGPMAQDFKLSFGVGTNDKTIYPLDESGVAFVAIQALNAKVDRLAAENARLRKQIETLGARRRARNVASRPDGQAAP